MGVSYKHAEIKPHKFNYYLERRDPEFDIKMAQVLAVYKEVAVAREQEARGATGRTWAVISYDEKPGIQALDHTAPDLPPATGQHATWSRDYEYVRKGALTLLAGIDLHDGRVIGLVRERHRSQEFTELLAEINQAYPADWKLRIILDNHSAHISKETMRWLKEHANRFEFTFTPKHGSWLNIVETFFSKMTRSFLRYVRVKSKEELKRRIEQWLRQVNEDPVVFHWSYKIDDAQV
jgi:transposase